MNSGFIFILSSSRFNPSIYGGSQDFGVRVKSCPGLLHQILASRRFHRFSFGLLFCIPHPHPTNLKSRPPAWCIKSLPNCRGSPKEPHLFPNHWLALGNVNHFVNFFIFGPPSGGPLFLKKYHIRSIYLIACSILDLLRNNLFYCNVSNLAAKNSYFVNVYSVTFPQSSFFSLKF